MANKACNEVVTVANMPMTVFDMISAMQNKYADRVAFRYVEGKDTVVEKTYAQYVQDIRKATGYLQQELGEPKGKKIVILSRTNYEYGAGRFWHHDGRRCHRDPEPGQDLGRAGA